MQINYKSATLYRKADFFTIIFHWRPSFEQKFIRFRKTYDLNRIKNIDVRIIAGQIMVETINEALENGYNPVTDTIAQDNPLSVLTNNKNKTPKHYSLKDAINKAHTSILLKSKKKRTHGSYDSHKKFLINYLTAIKSYNILAQEFSKMDAQDYQDFLIKKGYADNTVNNKIDYARGLFEWMSKRDIIESNPFNVTDNVKENESNANPIFTIEEIERIKQYTIENNCPEIWQYSLFIYYCYMRPDSIMHIQVKDIDFERKLIFIYGDNHKNSKNCSKQLLEPHLKYLKPYIEAAQLKPEEYLFTRNLKPGLKPVAPTRAAEFWKEHIKDKLGINKNAYGLKATGSIHFLENNNGNEPLKWLQMQMGHGDLQTTSIYTNKLKTVYLDENKNSIPEV